MPLSWSTLSSLVEIGARAYGPPIDPDNRPIWEKLQGTGWRYVTPAELGLSATLFDERGNFKGVFGAAAFVAFNASTGQLAVIFRGTDDFPDVLVDLQLALGGVPVQFAAFAGLLTAVEDAVESATHQFHGATVLTAGHSLGGAIAELYWSLNRDVVSGGVGFGSPGQLSFGIDGLPRSDTFVHLTRFEDAVGEYANGNHNGVGVEIWDDNFSDSNSSILLGIGGAAHSHLRYSAQLSLFANSPVAQGFDLHDGLRFRSMQEGGGNLTWTEIIGFDAILGSQGIDTINGADLAVRLVAEGANGDDQIRGGSVGDLLSGGADADTVFGGGGVDSIWGGGGADNLNGDSGGDYIEGGTGNDTLVGGSDGDSYSIGANQGQDTINDQGGSGADVLRLFTGTLYTAISESWFTRSGNDLLVNVPGTGIQVRIVNMGSAAGRIETAELFFGESSTPTTTLDLAALWTRLTTAPAPPPPTITGATQAPQPSVPTSGFTYTGGSGADLFLGTSGNDVARGLAGVDALAGDAGNDTLLGGADPDALNGGTGNDLLIDDDPGNFAVDNLDGGAGDDSLVFYGAPAGGTDIGNGGSGEDIALVDLRNANDDWRLNDDGSTTTIRPDVASDGGNIELQNVEVIAVLFGAGDDTALGDDAQYYFDGGDGNDQLSGDVHDDYLSGGPGDDRLDGEEGADWIDGGSGNDRATLNLSNVSADLTYLASQAALATGFTFANGAHVRNIERIDLATGSGNDQIWLGDFDDAVATNGGDDVITTEGRGRDTVDAGAGSDRLVLDFSWSATRIGSTLSSGIFTFYVGTSSASATNRVSAQGVENIAVTGTAFNDSIRGGDGEDVLNGGSGNDNVRGYGGDDILYGGAGDDLIDLGAGVDWADGGSGRDDGQIDRSTTTRNLTFNAILAGTQSGAWLEDGTYVRNIERWYEIDTGSGDDAVTMALGGQSTVNMRAGSDHLIVDHRSSTEALSAAPGLMLGVIPSYLVYTGLAFDGAADRIWGQGVERVTIMGGSAGDTITGLSGADTLNGNGGADNMNGGLGVDTSVYASLASSGATWTRNVDGTWTVNAGAQGTDTLTSVEFLDFTDRDVFLDRAARTFSGNGTSDVLFRSNTGIVASWEVTSSTINSANFLPTASVSEWSILGTGDIGGDGRDDVIWRQNTGLIYSWTMSGSGFAGAVALTGIGSEWTYLGSGDFNGDLTDDLAWQRNDGIVYVWQMGNSAIASANVVTGLGAEWSLEGLGDFSGDGRDDFLWRNTNNGELFVWTMNGATISAAGATSQQAAAGWSVAGVGDTNGDGRDDIILQRASDGMIAVWAMDGTTVLSATNVAAADPNVWNIRNIGDYNGDGRDDILWQHDNGLVYAWFLNGAAITGAGGLSGVGPEWGIIG